VLGERFPSSELSTGKVAGGEISLAEKMRLISLKKEQLIREGKNLRKRASVAPRSSKEQDVGSQSLLAEKGHYTARIKLRGEGNA